MNPLRKVRPDAVLKNLPLEKQRSIIDYLDGTDTSKPHSLRRAVVWLKEDGIKTEDTSLGDFRRWFLLRQGLETSAASTKQIVEYCKKNGWIKTRQEEEAASLIFFNHDTVAQKNARLWAVVQGVSLRRDRLELDVRKLKLLEQRDAQTNEVLNNTQMTTEQKETRIRQIMGLDL